MDRILSYAVKLTSIFLHVITVLSLHQKMMLKKKKENDVIWERHLLKNLHMKYYDVCHLLSVLLSFYRESKNSCANVSKW